MMHKLPQSQLQKTSNTLTVDAHYLYGSADGTYFDKMFPILMGFFVLFVF